MDAMDAFTIEIAGLAVRVEPVFLSTRDYCKAYLTQSAGEVRISISRADLDHQQTLLAQEAIEEKLRIRKFTDPFLERAVIQRKIAEELLKRDTILLHGSTVGVDGEAYLFTAPCGTGKSTHTRNWCAQFGERAVMVNDDQTFLRITDSGVYAYGSPWSGKHGLDTNICLPLKGICFLQRGSENLIDRVKPENWLDTLYHLSFIPEDPHGHLTAISLVNRLSQTVPLWKMECTKDSTAALVSYKAMSDAR